MAKEHLYKSYVTTAATIIQQYNGSTPFNDYLKKYFALHKKYGSRDRKHITHLCYCYYRLGHAELGLEVEERILLALFLCSNDTHEIISELRPEWKENITDSLQDKLQLLGYPFSIENIFPWQDELSEGIDATAFALSHLTQPELFLRIRPGQRERALSKLKANTILFEEYGNDCLALFNATKIDDILEVNKEVVVQDYSSQRIAEFLELTKLKTQNSKPKVWDCCAASGGKSLLAVDTLGNIDLTVSDMRPSIIQNLKKRFAAAGITKYHSFIADLTNQKSEIRNLQSDIIICDVPCSGSGTWGRTPEQLYFFSSEKIDYYANLQKQIVQNVIKHVNKNGYFLYITCSVFKKENEDVVDFILASSKLQLIKKKVLVGYDKKADTMFGALFILDR
ncbi:Fmu (Sun) domain-containing protein [Panacibacter ginsenosidivorans]|uniref:Fmu (Sun) domain-containing protein n=1 Tax=Panacibacter ginsenosidivorans TaxID=1813871 RepID=A0A5B8VB53_9BACT|nr:Fmu (Sun) domain-containing protein [Panacibacter ginsenosidivorans]QEC68664.1 Fmu (Sun) domain-containing protein [Panacibacter ginsenosidivorans]